MECGDVGIWVVELIRMLTNMSVATTKYEHSPIEGPPRKSPHTLMKVWKRPVTRAVPGVDMRGLSKDTARGPTGVDLRMGWSRTWMRT
ncbi:GD19975 [Drosophila simulans]|uniref:GD19975 n=1 Tax=Drosophila simulans TaxID=7240 RepID=B4R0E7_DROSI|nr:GD19975 [Drosophila simulans]